MSWYSNSSFELKILNIGDPFNFGVIPPEMPQIFRKRLNTIDGGLQIALRELFYHFRKQIRCQRLKLIDLDRFQVVSQYLQKSVLITSNNVPSISRIESNFWHGDLSRRRAMSLFEYFDIRI